MYLKIIAVCIILLCGGGYYYLDDTNYFFDKKLENLASPLLKEIMVDGYRNIPGDIFCSSFDTTQVQIDMFDILTGLVADKKYKDISVSLISYAPQPKRAFRFTGNEEIDGVFNDEQIIHCNHGKAYDAFKKIFITSKRIFPIDKNFRVYNLIYQPMDDSCLHCNFALNNAKSFPNQLFVTNVEPVPAMPHSNFWIIKYGKYYYMLSSSNMATNAINTGDSQDMHIVWQKMTKQELASYDRGIYWGLINKYHIIID